MYRGLVHGVLSFHRHFHWLWYWGVPRTVLWMQPNASLPWQTWEEWKKWLFIWIATTLSHFKLTCLGLLSCGKWVNLFFLSIRRLRLCTPEGYPAARTFVPLWKLALFPQQHFPMGDHSKIAWCSWIPPLCPGLSGYRTFLRDSYALSVKLQCVKSVKSSCCTRCRKRNINQRMRKVR